MSLSRFRLMASPVFFALASLVLFRAPSYGAKPQPPITLLARADPLPLAIDPAFQLRKFKSYFLESIEVQHINTGGNELQSLVFERRHLLFGAITGSDIRDCYGDYYTFWWRALKPANLTLRLEYRQQKLAGMIQAREVNYPDARGSYITRLAVNGDDYLEQGRVSAWRVLLIEDHSRIVALTQSYLWR